MPEKLKELFSSIGIEYYGVLSYTDCRETYERIRASAGFEPRSVIVYLLPYYSGECENVSRYAASLDYHMEIRTINLKIEEYIKAEFENAGCRGYGDHSPIDERHAALSLGLGIAGENRLLLNEKYGSYVFIGDVLTDIEPDLLGAKAPLEITSCEGCGLCRTACPTGLLRGEAVECLSAITQKKGVLSEEEAELMRKCGTAWGCDICQSACPHNREPKMTPLEFFCLDRISSLTSEALSSMSDEEFNRRAFAWRGRRTIMRNMEILENREKNNA